MVLKMKRVNILAIMILAAPLTSFANNTGPKGNNTDVKVNVVGEQEQSQTGIVNGTNKNDIKTGGANASGVGIGKGGAGGQGGAGGSSKIMNSFNYEVPPSSAVAALVATSSSCFGSGSGGFGNSSVNLSFGKTYKDHECNVRENTKVLAGLNNLALANENMCNIAEVLESDARLPLHYRVCMQNRTEDKAPVPFTENTGSHWIGTDPMSSGNR